MDDQLPGLVPGKIHILTLDQARTGLPELFSGDPDEPYFNELGAHGNAEWVDYWPEMIVVVRAPDGTILLASNASAWHLTACGYQAPTTPAE